MVLSQYWNSYLQKRGRTGNKLLRMRSKPFWKSRKKSIYVQFLISSASIARWGKALLKPLLKKCGLDMAFNNFRLVSSLPYVSKLSEKAAANQLIDDMTTNDLHMPLRV